MQVIDIEERDANFHKLWLGHILSVDRSYRKPENASSVLILDHLDSNNLLPMTQRQIANKSGISYQTVSRTLQALIDSNFFCNVLTRVHIASIQMYYSRAERLHG